MTSQIVILANFQFFSRHFGVSGVNISKVKNPWKCHDLQGKCKILIRDWIRLFGVRVNNKGRHFVKGKQQGKAFC